MRLWMNKRNEFARNIVTLREDLKNKSDQS